MVFKIHFKIHFFTLALITLLSCSTGTVGDPNNNGEMNGELASASATAIEAVFNDLQQISTTISPIEFCDFSNGQKINLFFADDKKNYINDSYCGSADSKKFKFTNALKPVVLHVIGTIEANDQVWYLVYYDFESKFERLDEDCINGKYRDGTECYFNSYFMAKGKGWIRQRKVTTAFGTGNQFNIENASSSSFTRIITRIKKVKRGAASYFKLSIDHNIWLVPQKNVEPYIIEEEKIAAVLEKDVSLQGEKYSLIALFADVEEEQEGRKVVDRIVWVKTSDLLDITEKMDAKEFIDTPIPLDCSKEKNSNQCKNREEIDLNRNSKPDYLEDLIQNGVFDNRGNISHWESNNNTTIDWVETDAKSNKESGAIRVSKSFRAQPTDEASVVQCINFKLKTERDLSRQNKIEIIFSYDRYAPKYMNNSYYVGHRLYPFERPDCPEVERENVGLNGETESITSSRYERIDDIYYAESKTQSIRLELYFRKSTKGKSEEITESNQEPFMLIDNVTLIQK